MRKLRRPHNPKNNRDAEELRGKGFCMVIDFHVHVREGHGEVKDLLNAMDAFGIDMAVVHPIASENNVLGYGDNAFVGKLVKQYPTRLMGFASVLPYKRDAADTLERAIGEYGLKGLKLHPAMQNYPMTDPCMYGISEKCIELDIPILIHTGTINAREARIEYCDSLPIDDLAIRYPEAKYVIAHGNPLGIDPAMICKHDNVYLDTTGTFARYVEMLPSAAPMCYKRMRKNDRIVFGTDANPLNATVRITDNIEPLRGLDNISAEDKELLFCGNAKRLLKMD